MMRIRKKNNHLTGKKESCKEIDFVAFCPLRVNPWPMKTGD